MEYNFYIGSKVPIRQFGRVVKLKDYKSFGIFPHRFESCNCRITTVCCIAFV